MSPCVPAGTYPTLPPLPAVGGNEGVGEVLEVGRRVTALKPGDRVILAVNNLGECVPEPLPSHAVLLRPPRGASSQQILGMLEAARSCPGLHEGPTLGCDPV